MSDGFAGFICGTILWIIIFLILVGTMKHGFDSQIYKLEQRISDINYKVSTKSVVLVEDKYYKCHVDYEVK